MIDPRVSALCQEFGVKIVPAHIYPQIRETRAPETLRRIINRHGMEHARLVLSTLAETSNNAVLLDEVALWMCSDMLRALPLVVEHQASDWLATWDAMPVGQLQFVTQDLSGIVPQRHALGGMVYERLYRRFGPNAEQLDLLDDRRRTA